MCSSDTLPSENSSWVLQRGLAKPTELLRQRTGLGKLLLTRVLSHAELLSQALTLGAALVFPRHAAGGHKGSKGSLLRVGNNRQEPKWFPFLKGKPSPQRGFPSKQGAGGLCLVVGQRSSSPSRTPTWGYRHRPPPASHGWGGAGRGVRRERKGKERKPKSPYL